MSNRISLQQAIDLTTNFRKQKDTIVSADLSGKDIIPACETFDREVFDDLLKTEGCVKVRVYSGLTKDLQFRSVIVAVNDKDEDILPEDLYAVDGGGKVIVEDGQICPPYCPPPSPLNP